jgi:hypothetical protein
MAGLGPPPRQGKRIAFTQLAAEEEAGMIGVVVPGFAELISGRPAGIGNLIFPAGDTARQILPKLEPA